MEVLARAAARGFTLLARHLAQGLLELMTSFEFGFDSLIIEFDFNCLAWPLRKDDTHCGAAPSEAPTPRGVPTAARPCLNVGIHVGCGAMGSGAALWDDWHEDERRSLQPLFTSSVYKLERCREDAAWMLELAQRRRRRVRRADPEAQLKAREN